MSLLIAAGIAFFFVALWLLVELKAVWKGDASRVRRDERISMRQDEDMEFFNETDTEGQEDDPQG